MVLHIVNRCAKVVHGSVHLVRRGRSRQSHAVRKVDPRLVAHFTLGQHTFGKLLGLLDLNAMVAGRGVNMARGNFAPSFELQMARKDVRLMLETAGDRPLAALPAIAARMDQLIAAGHGAKDASVLGIDAVRRP